MEPYIFVVASWLLLAGALAVVVLLIRQMQISARLRKRNRVLEHDLRVFDEETQYLVSTRLPALAESLHGKPVDVPGPLNEHGVDSTFGKAMMALFTASVEQAIARGEQSGKATLKVMMRAVQSLANEQQFVLSNMQERHDNPDVLEDLLRLDHMNSQLGRRAQATVVLCGSWPGQQRSASSLTDVVGGATSRIRDFLRIHVPTLADIAVVSRAVEPVVLALAELLDNGARHSPPTTTVEVNFQQAHNGVAIMIDDAGVGMSVEETQQASKLLSGLTAVDINRLGDPPRIGFPVIGVLAARYGFTVSVDTRSPYGGVRAVMFLPNELLTRATKPKAVHERAVTTSVDDAEPSTSVRTASGLPMRRRRTPAGESVPAARAATDRPAVGPSAPPAQSAPTTPSSKAALGMGAWQRGTKSGRASLPEGSTEA
jgi:hypothetical protein